jgi:hypothetical protein
MVNSIEHTHQQWNTGIRWTGTSRRFRMVVGSFAGSPEAPLPLSSSSGVLLYALSLPIPQLWNYNGEVPANGESMDDIVTRPAMPYEWLRAVMADATSQELKLIPSMIKAANGKGANAHPGNRQLCEEAHLSNRDVMAVLARWVDRGYLVITYRAKRRKGWANNYSFAVPLAEGESIKTTGGTQNGFIKTSGGTAKPFDTPYGSDQPSEGRSGSPTVWKWDNDLIWMLATMRMPPGQEVSADLARQIAKTANKERWTKEQLNNKIKDHLAHK